MGLWCSNNFVVASGYFNPLHAGHLDYLEAAAALGTRLIVIVNNDFQVTLEGRQPFMNEDERVRLIQSLRIVDEVVLSLDADRSVSQTLAQIHPRIFATGGENCLEKEVCDYLGIRMVFGVGGFQKRQSSSSLLQKIRQSG